MRYLDCIFKLETGKHGTVLDDFSCQKKSEIHNLICILFSFYLDFYFVLGKGGGGEGVAPVLIND